MDSPEDRIKGARAYCPYCKGNLLGALCGTCHSETVPACTPENFPDEPTYTLWPVYPVTAETILADMEWFCGVLAESTKRVY